MAIRPLVAAAARPLVFCSDWRGVANLPDDIADTLVWIMRRDNPRIECNAILVSETNLAVQQQAQKIVAEAHLARRRVFTELAALRAHLDPQLEAAERRRLDAFLSEGP